MKMEIIKKADEKLTRILLPVNPEAGIIYIPSQFILSFEHKGIWYTFNNLTKQCIVGKLPKQVSAGEGYDQLISAQFLVPINKDECAYYNQISSLMRTYYKKKGIKSYTILPTLGCNARCVYCYEEKMKQITMTDDTVEQTVRFILDTHSENKVDLRWFGGEPLMFPEIIDRICKGLQGAGVEFSSRMVSNGSMITPDIIRRMKGNWKILKIQISMDGAQEDYYSRKNYKIQHDYYHSVLEAISRMSEEGIHVSIRCNVDAGNWDRIPYYLEDLKSGIGNKEHVSLYFAPLNHVRESENDLDLWKKIKDAKEWIEEAGIHSAPFLGPVMRFRLNHCMADGEGVVIGPDGSLYPCEYCLPEIRYGDIWNGVTDEAIRKEFIRTDRTRVMCQTCPFLPNCTSFSACPVLDNHCRELREMMTVDTLKRMVDKKGYTVNENVVC